MTLATNDIIEARPRPVAPLRDLVTDAPAQTDTLDLSIILVSWNTRELLRDCLTTIRQHLRCRYEVFVVDNASSDDSADMVAREFEDVKLIANSCNRGFAGANNQAIRTSRGRYVLLLNTDTQLHDDSLDRLVQEMDRDPSIGMAGLQLLNADGSLQNSIANIPSLLTELAKKSLLRLLFPRRFPGKEFQPRTPIEVESLIGACMMVRSELIRCIGPLDEDYFLFLEETDWALRMRQAGAKIVFFPNLSIYHLQGRSAAKAPQRARIEYWRSRYIFFRKHYRGLERAVLCAGLLCELSIDIVWFAALYPHSAKARRRLPVYASILAWHLLGMPRHWGLQSKNCRPLDEPDNGHPKK